MATVYLALGSNMGDRAQNIERGVELLSEQVQIAKRAKIYESKAVGFEAQDNFLNTVVSGTTELSPITLLEFVKKIEKSVGRQERFKWGPREIDIDILFYDNLVYADDDLEIPHKEIASRDFVLTPLAEIAPEFKHPTLGKTVAELEKGFPADKRSIVAKTDL